MTSPTERELGWPSPYNLKYLSVYADRSTGPVIDGFLEGLARQVGEQVIQDGGSAEDARVAEERSRAVLGLGSLGTASSSSTSSASSPQSARSGISSRSLPGLMKSWLAGCLPFLLAATSESIRRRLILSSASSGKGGTSRP